MRLRHSAQLDQGVRTHGSECQRRGMDIRDGQHLRKFIAVEVDECQGLAAFLVLGVQLKGSAEVQGRLVRSPVMPKMLP